MYESIQGKLKRGVSDGVWVSVWDSVGRSVWDELCDLDPLGDYHV